MKTIELLHGSRVEFSKFSKEGARFNTGQSILGHFLTDDGEQALLYSEPTVEEVTDALEIDDDLLRSDRTFIDYSSDNPGFIYKVEAAFTSMKIEPALNSGTARIDDMQLNFNDEQFEAYRQSLVHDGFDAVCFETPDGYNEFVFLHAHQLKITKVIPANEFQDSLSRAPAI